MKGAPVEHFMKEVATLEEDRSVVDAAAAMRAGAVGCLVVTRAGAPVGMLTDRDLLVRVIANGKDPAAIRVVDVMSEPLLVASPSDPLDKVVELMSARGIRRLPILEREQLVGIVTLDDVFAELADELHELAEGSRRELARAQRSARSHELARELGERVQELGVALERLGLEARHRLLEEIDALRERLGRSRD